METVQRHHSGRVSARLQGASSVIGVVTGQNIQINVFNDLTLLKKKKNLVAVRSPLRCLLGRIFPPRSSAGGGAAAAEPRTPENLPVCVSAFSLPDRFQFFFTFQYFSFCLNKPMKSLKRAELPPSICLYLQEGNTSGGPLSSRRHEQLLHGSAQRRHQPLHHQVVKY